MPCNPTPSFPSPSAPSVPGIPGLGVPFATPVAQSPFPSGFPEDLMDLLNNVTLLLPPGALHPMMHPNYSKDIFDAIIDLLEQYMPFLMMYKFFLPALNLIICIIEVLCALMNPFALISALDRLFSVCIPEFLNLFPIFALIVMIISILLLLLKFIIYLIEQIVIFVENLLRNIIALVKAFQTANEAGILAIAIKLGNLLCMFQNFFVMLEVFTTIIEVIKDILSLIFAIPPCEGGGPNSTTGCCSATTCPTIVQNPYTRETGTLQYLNQVGIQTSLIIPGGNFNVDLVNESWQIFDTSQTKEQKFINIVDSWDVNPSVNPKPVFFPTDASYTANTPPNQAAYTVNLRFYYNPYQWARAGTARYVRFNNCIVLAAPTSDLKIYNNNNVIESNGVLYITGGLGYEDDNTTQLTGYATDGITPISSQATLNNFIHKAAIYEPTPILSPTDGYTFQNLEYTFTPNLSVLLQKNLVTLGCEPSIMLSRAFVNNVAFGNIAVQTSELTSLVNGNTFPNPAAAQQCLSMALTALQSNLTVEGVAEFQTTATLCLNKLQNDTNNALTSLIGIGFSPCNSTIALDTNTQFTTLPITVTVSLNENNGISLASSIPSEVSSAIAPQIIPYITFGTINSFTYDGYQKFTAEISSNTPGSGQIMVSFNNNIICTNVMPVDGTPSHTLQTLDYTFIYSPYANENTNNKQRRDDGDLARDSVGDS